MTLIFRSQNILCQWRIQDGAFGANVPPPIPYLVEEPVILLIKIATKLYQTKKLMKTCTFY